MIAVIFEAKPVKGKRDEYLDIAAGLRPELNNIEGFISIERYQSMVNPEKVLSLSFWRDEQSVAAWRNLEAHRAAQVAGRNSISRITGCGSRTFNEITEGRIVTRPRTTARKCIKSEDYNL